MNVLVCCEESQAVCLAFRARGHNAFSCDLQPCSGGHPEWHIQDDVLKYINGKLHSFDFFFVTEDGSFHLMPDRWDLLIAHPPCTFLNNAGNGIMQFLNCDCPRVCVENPVPNSLFGLPPCTQIIDPSYFGSHFKKRTCLWLRGLPPLFATVLDYDAIPTIDADWFNRGTERQKNRSKTFPEVAQAMAAQWG